MREAREQGEKGVQAYTMETNWTEAKERFFPGTFAESREDGFISNDLTVDGTYMARGRGKMTSLMLVVGVPLAAAVTVVMAFSSSFYTRSIDTGF